MILYILLTILILIVLSYSIFLKVQIRSINNQLTNRINKNSRELISVELLDKDMNLLAKNINTCLKTEESLRLKSASQESSLRDMIANISHDLRTPLTAIKGYQQLIEKNELSSHQRHRLHVAQRYSTELNTLINEFFQYSYLSASHPKPLLEPVNISSVLRECVADSVNLFESSGFQVHLDIPPRVICNLNKDSLNRIFMNLLRNCLNHSKGDVHIRLLEDDKVTLEFTNPIDPKLNINPQNMFDRFYSSTSNDGKSTGLGLSIVKLLIEDMDGSIWASKEKNSLKITMELTAV